MPMLSVTHSMPVVSVVTVIETGTKPRLVSLNEAVFVAGTLVMQSCTGDSYLIRCLIHRPTRYSYSAGFGATTCRL